MAELIVDNVVKEYDGVAAADHISLKVQKGLYGLLGTNGAGKTTLMRMICTVTAPTSGAIYFQGENILEMGARYRDKIGYLPQEFGYYPDFSVRNYLRYISALKGLPKRFSEQKIAELLKSVGLTECASKKMKNLSGGMKRRVGIAQAMLNDPEILILDEPTIGLDPMERIHFRNLISGLAEDKIVLLSSHIVSDLETIAGEVFIMKDGKIVNRGTVNEICRQIPIKVWMCRAENSDAEGIIAAQGGCVVNVRKEGSVSEIRVISENRPHESAVLTDVSLEDAFFYQFGMQEDRRCWDTN